MSEYKDERLDDLGTFAVSMLLNQASLYQKTTNNLREEFAEMLILDAYMILKRLADHKFQEKDRQVVARDMAGLIAEMAQEAGQDFRDFAVKALREVQ